MASMTIYVLGYSLELSSLNLRTMLFWSKIEYIGICTFPTLFLLFVLQFTGRERWITWKVLVLLFLVPAALLYIKLTDGIFHLIYSTTWVDVSGAIPLLGFNRGPVYPAALYAVLPVIIGIFLLVKTPKNTMPLYRSQIKLIIVSAAITLSVFIYYMVGLRPFPETKFFDLNVFVFPFWGIMLGWAIFQYHLFDVAPIARDALIEHTEDGAFVLDGQNRLVDANPAALEIMEWKHLPIGEDVGQVFSIWKEQLNTLSIDNAYEKRKFEIQHTLGGMNKFYDLTVTPLQEKKGKIIGHLIMLHDITNLKDLQNKLLELSIMDELTGLYNRRGFYLMADHFLQMVDRINAKAAVIFIDLDSMKMINDTFGHAEGDRALMETAELLRKNLRSSDILARFGGDEFVAMVLESENKGFKNLFARIDKQFIALNNQVGRKYPLLASHGVAYYNPSSPCSLDELMEKSDKAMYENKQSKKQSGSLDNTAAN